MGLLRIESLHMENFRCFETLDVAFEPDVTVFFAENAGGKSAVLDAVAKMLHQLLPARLFGIAMDAQRDVRRIRYTTGQDEPAGACVLECTASIGSVGLVGWSAGASAATLLYDLTGQNAWQALETARRPGTRWPLIAYYGTGRLAHLPMRGPKQQQPTDRRDGYADCLEPSITDEPLLRWLAGVSFDDFVRHSRGDTVLHMGTAVLEAMKRATPGVADVWYAPAPECPMVGFKDGSVAAWRELSDGFHVFLALVGDIARRAAILNGQDGIDAPLLVEGVVLIDEIDLHLHPRWQRTVIRGLRAAFPKLQFIVTTHSPQVLSSVENRQVRFLSNFRLREHGVFVEGRDSNAILRDLMDTDDRDDRGKHLLDELYGCIDRNKLGQARELLAKLESLWGDIDPEVIRAGTWLRDEYDEEGSCDVS